MRLSIEKAARPAQERTPAPTLQAEHIARDVLSQVGTMISARFEALEERLLPEKRLRPPLAADRRSAEPGPSSAPDPTPTSLGETWSAVVRKGKGKGKKTAPALDVQMSASISAKPKKSVAKPVATPKPPTAAPLNLLRCRGPHWSQRDPLRCPSPVRHQDPLWPLRRQPPLIKRNGGVEPANYVPLRRQL
ncbi:unnamed protein product, partial [Iphiclides podalirius]